MAIDDKEFSVQAKMLEALKSILESSKKLNEFSNDDLKYANSLMQDEMKEYFRKIKNNFNDFEQRLQKEYLKTYDVGIKVKGHKGTWYKIATYLHDGITYYQLEHERYGDDAEPLLIDEDGNVLEIGFSDRFDVMCHFAYENARNKNNEFIYSDKEISIGYYVDGNVRMDYKTFLKIKETYLSPIYKDSHCDFAIEHDGKRYHGACFLISKTEYFI